MSIQATQAGRLKAVFRSIGYVCVWAAFCCAPMACMTPERAVRESDETATRLATAYWREQTGVTNDVFDVHRPADALTLRVAMLAAARGDQRVVFPKIPHVEAAGSSNGVLRLSLKDALALAARNDRAYQNHKEAIFNRALDLDYQQYAFETTFSGMILSILDGDFGTKTATGRGNAGFDKTFQNGTKVAGMLAADLVTLLREDWRSAAFSGDLSVTVPLLRGAGRDVVMEPLTQAERNLVYAIRQFEYYRQTYAVSVANSYFSVLKAEQVAKNSVENHHRLELNSKRADMMFKAGRMDRIQMDQAHTDLLGAEEGVISTRKSYQSALDNFKVKIGLPPEGKIELDNGELTILEKKMEKIRTSTQDALEGFPSEFEACRIALTERHDLFVTRCEYEDVARNVKVVADRLRPDLTLKGGPSFNRKRQTGEGSFRGDEIWDATAQMDLPWNRRAERNAFRKQLISLEQARRTLEAKEDEVKQTIRDDMRGLEAARASYENAVRAMTVAKQRVSSNDLFLQSGRSSMRDILEAESALLSARNSLCSALVNWWMSDLELRRDMGVLRIGESGMWVLPNGEHHG
ncbi:MAG: TolC family protein [Kiritimatiellae bacterium]|nr:TolC family protein [Kiritimatiellia bacterium]